MAVATKGEKKRWHREMKPIACQEANSTCQLCGQFADLETGAMYFQEWPAGMYSGSVLDLMRQDICFWVCGACHQEHSLYATKSEKYLWHKVSKLPASLHASEKCHDCGKHTPEAEGVVHHEVYPPGVYKRDVISLMNEGICVWLCNGCHKDTHMSDCVEDGVKAQQRGGTCYFCGRQNYGGWERAKLRGHNNNICRRCWRSGKKERKREESGQLSLLDMLS